MFLSRSYSKISTWYSLRLVSLFTRWTPDFQELRVQDRRKNHQHPDALDYTPGVCLGVGMERGESPYRKNRNRTHRLFEHGCMIFVGGSSNYPLVSWYQDRTIRIMVFYQVVDTNGKRIVHRMATEYR